MGTRADFYLGRNPEKMKWLGSIAYDGYPEGWPRDIIYSKTEEEYLKHLKKIQKSRSFTEPSQGWPWPWEDSGTTDFSYAFDDEKVYMSAFGRRWLPIENKIPRYRKYDKSGVVKFPDMTHIQNVTFGNRSGLLILSAV